MVALLAAARETATGRNRRDEGCPTAAETAEAKTYATDAWNTAQQP
jgi:hypothetical protein